MPNPSDPDPTPSPDPDDPWADDPTAPAEPGPRPPHGTADPAARSRLEDEILFQRTRRELAAGPPPVPAPRGGRVLLLAAAAAVTLAFREEGARWVGAAVPVVLLHEAGHLLGTRLLGVRNPRLFILPAFAALARGYADVAPWRTAVALLLGPLPGIAAGLGYYTAERPSAGTWGFDLCLVAVVFNALNLLPVIPLDGGRLFDVLFLARRPWPGTVYRLLAAAGLVAGGATVEGPVGRYGLMGIGGLVLLATPVAHLRAAARRALGRRFPGLPVRAGELTDAQVRTLLTVVRRARPFEDDPRRLAAAVRGLHAQATARPAGVLVSGLLMAAYLGGAGATVRFLVLYAEATVN